MAADFGNVKSDAGLSKLNEHLVHHSYIVSCEPSAQDAAVWAKLIGCPPAAKFPAAARWYRHIASFSEEQRRAGFAQVKKAVAEAQKKQPKDDEDEDFDLFGDVTPEESAAVAAVVAGSKKEVKKKVVIAKSQLVIDIKPCSVDTDLDLLEKLVREIKIEGLEWSVTCKRLPVAFGLMKLQIGAVIIDDLTNTEDILTRIECIGLDEAAVAEKVRRRDAGDEEEEGEEEEPDGLVMSAEIVSFNKL